MAGTGVHEFHFFFFRATCEHLLKCKTCICFDPALCRKMHKNICKRKEQETIQLLMNGLGGGRNPLHDGIHMLKNCLAAQSHSTLLRPHRL